MQPSTAGTLPDAVLAVVDEVESTGATAVLVMVDGAVAGVIGVADTVKDSAADAVSALRGLGLTTVLLSGDSERVAQAVAGRAGFDEAIAGVSPAGKADVVRRLQAEGHRVAMVGDGVNDSAALATADLGLAMVTGTDIAMKAADIILVRDDLMVVVDAIVLSRRTLRTIRGNLIWAFGYNVAAIPLAAAGLLNPLIAAAAMALSSMFVVSNSLRLRSFRPAARSGDDRAGAGGRAT
jgi:P-type Cu+ transporter